MHNPRLDQLTDYPFLRLAALLDGIEPGQAFPGQPPLAMSIGEPQHPVPALVSSALSRHAALWGKYPPIAGAPQWKEAVAGWIARRYGVPDGMVPLEAILPVSGTREALYMIAQVALPEQIGGQPPLVLMPNPFYQVYLGGVIMQGGEALLVDAGPDSGFLADFANQPSEVLDRAAMVIACSPGNPQGAVLSLEGWKELILLARKHDFLLVADECYSEIYLDHPPAGALEACHALGGSLDHVVVFNSLSKRSSVPGFRSGFVAGDPEMIARFQRLRAYAAAGMPLPLQMASAELWSEETHVQESRALYQAKVSDAVEILRRRLPGLQAPAGGFFLWVPVEDGEATTRLLWEQAGVKVLPGRYLARDTVDPDSGMVTGNVGAPYIRIALVHDRQTTRDALERCVSVL
jgi:aspartate/methionine/tyrosine aminotransferase